MQEVTINTDNFDYIEFINYYSIINYDGYVTKSEDRNNNKGILVFIPIDENRDEIIEDLKH